MFSEILSKIKEEPKDLNSNAEIMELLNDNYEEADFFAKLRSESQLSDEDVEKLESEFDALDLKSELQAV